MLLDIIISSSIAGAGMFVLTGGTSLTVVLAIEPEAVSVSVLVLPLSIVKSQKRAWFLSRVFIVSMWWAATDHAQQLVCCGSWGLVSLWWLLLWGLAVHLHFGWGMVIGGICDAQLLPSDLMSMEVSNLLAVVIVMMTMLPSLMADLFIVSNYDLVFSLSINVIERWPSCLWVGLASVRDVPNRWQ